MPGSHSSALWPAGCDVDFSIFRTRWAGDVLNKVSRGCSEQGEQGMFWTRWAGDVLNKVGCAGTLWTPLTTDTLNKESREFWNEMGRKCWTMWAGMFWTRCAGTLWTQLTTHTVNQESREIWNEMGSKMLNNLSGNVLNKVRRNTLNTINHRNSKPGEQGNLERLGHSEQDDQGYSEAGHYEHPLNICLTEHVCTCISNQMPNLKSLIWG